jgi:DNA-binding transcriptional LysR family regulator
MQQLSWDDLKLLMLVAEHKSLQNAAQVCGSSSATISRRLLRLEQLLGRNLFERSNKGYQLTAFGSEVVQSAMPMKAAAKTIEKLSEQSSARPILRITAGAGTTRFLIHNFGAIYEPNDPFSVKLESTEEKLEIAHRQCDLAIRNSRPSVNNLAFQKLGNVSFRAYAHSTLASAKDIGWTVVSVEHARHPASKWVHSLNEPLCAISSTVDGVYELVRSGQGKAVFPEYVAALYSDLVPVSPPISQLNEDLYLVMHNDDRFRNEMRILIKRIRALYRG